MAQDELYAREPVQALQHKDCFIFQTPSGEDVTVAAIDAEFHIQLINEGAIQAYVYDRIINLNGNTAIIQTKTGEHIKMFGQDGREMVEWMKAMTGSAA